MSSLFNSVTQLFVGNGFGFGKYWAGYIFGKNPKDQHFLYLGEGRMAILSAGIDEDGEKSILVATDEFSLAQLSEYFPLDASKHSAINWLDQTVHVILLCEKPDTVRSNMRYYMWPAVTLDFTTELSENTIVIYDRFTPAAQLQSLKNEAQAKGVAGKTEFWSMLKFLTMGDRFGELAPKICMESVPE
jgi:hypothetical protein